MYSLSSTCNECITSLNCGYCFEDGQERTSGSCLPLTDKHQERYASDTLNVTFRCNETNYNADSPKYVWANNYCPTSYAWMAILGLGLFVVGFAPGSFTTICTRVGHGEGTKDLFSTCDISICPD